MGKQSRRKKKNKQWVKRRPDEVISAGTLRIERYGRFIRYSNNATPKEHAANLQRAAEANKRVLTELAVEVPLLQNMVGRFDAVELMHRAAYMLLPLFLKHKSEYEFAADEVHSLPAVEYLQYLIARTEVCDERKAPSEQEWDELWEQARKVLLLTQHHLMFRGTHKTPPSEIDELRFLLDSRRLAMRVRRYPIFFADHLRSSLTPYEQQIEEVYGVGVNEIVDGLKKIDEYQKFGVIGRYMEMKTAQVSLMARLHEKGYAVDPGAAQDEVERTRAAIASDEFKALHDELQEKIRLTFTSAIFEITDLTALPRPFLSLLAVKPGESILTTLTGPNHDDLSPLSTSVLHYKPFLEVNGRFYTFYHSGFEDRISEIIEVDLFNSRPKKISVMAKRRSDRVESDAKSLLASILRPDFVLQNAYYPNPDEVGNLTELDLLLGADDILFLVEVKAGGFSESASRGAPSSMEKEFLDLIIEGQRQSERAEKYIKLADEVAFLDETGKNEIFRLRNAQFRRIFRIVITREDLGWVGARIAVLSVLDPNLSKSFPWHISIDDLRVVSELFDDDEIRFVHYLEQRLRASSETTLTQHDEIDHVALYNAMNLYHELPVSDVDMMTFDGSYMHDIDHYFMEKAAGGSPVVPTQKMSAKMRALLSALRDSRLAGRFEAGSIVLSMDGEARQGLEKCLDTIDASRAEGRQRSFRIPFSGISISYADDTHWQEELKRSAVQMKQAGCKQWVVVQLENKDQYRVSKIEIVSPNRFSDEELAVEKSRLESRTQQTVMREKTSRNDQCPCGSGKKFKKCHGA
jgi:hypothetical protein